MKWSLLLLTALLLIPITAYAHGAEHGGQAIEVQGYNLELVAEPEAKGTHLHLYLTDAQEKLVTTAQVKLQIIAPAGMKIIQPMTYDANEKSYVADLPVTTKGEYKVVALTTLAGKRLSLCRIVHRAGCRRGNAVVRPNLLPLIDWSDLLSDRAGVLTLRSDEPVIRQLF